MNEHPHIQFLRDELAQLRLERATFDDPKVEFIDRQVRSTALAMNTARTAELEAAIAACIVGPLTLRPLAAEESAQTAAALRLHKQLAAVILANVPVINPDRAPERLQLARDTRDLFRRLGISGISVTVPRYSQACSVDLRLPRRRDHLMTAAGDVVDLDPARIANSAAEARLREILYAAFPGTDTSRDDRHARWTIN